MRINRVHLENYRVHESLDIEFSSGINLLLGENGRGKSSILEAIGYALFDSGLRTNNQKEAIKYGKKSARVEVEFIGIDGEEYRVVRKIPGTTQLFKGDELLDGRIEKIKELCGIKGEMKDIYDNVIVAKQNEFIVAFKEKSSEREKIFNKVFNTDIYAKIYEGYSREIATKYERELDLVNNNIQNISEILLDTDELREKLEFYKENLKVQKEYEKLLEGKYQKIKNDIKTIRDLQTDIKQSNILKETLEKNILEREKEKKDTKISLHESELAIEVVNQNRERYNLYQEVAQELVKLKEKRKTIEKERERYLKYERDKGGLEYTLSRLDSELELFKNRIDNFETSKCEKKEVLNDLKEEKEKNEILAKELIKEIERVQPILNVALETEERIEKASQTLERQKLKLEEKEEELRQLNLELEILEKKNIAEALKELEFIEAKLKDLEGKNRILATQYEEGQEAFKLLNSAMCPYLKENCENLKGKDITLFFRDKLKKIDEEKKSNEIKIDNLIQSLKDKDKIQSESYKYEELKKESEVKKIEFKNEILKLENWKVRYELGVSEYERYKLENKFLNSVELRDLKLSYEVKLGTLEIEKYQKEISKLLAEIEKIENEVFKTKSELNGSNKKRVEVLENLEKVKFYLLENKDVEKRFGEIARDVQSTEERIAELEKAKELYIENYKKANEKAKYEKTLETIEKKMALDRESIEKVEILLKELEAKISIYNLDVLQLEEEKIDLDLKDSREKIGNINSEIAYQRQILEEAQKRESRLKEEKEKIERLKSKIQLTKVFRDKIKNMGKEVAKNMLKEIEVLATENFRKITGRGERISWSNEDKDRYLVYLLGDRGELKFEQLSGGEQVAVAISIRGAMSEIFTDSKFSIFDEPTNNLDNERRRSLADSIGEILKNLDQSIIVTHDDTFREMAQRVIEL